jgi:hypothetical protein
MSKNTQIGELINYISVDGSGDIVMTGNLIMPGGAQAATQTYVTTAISNLVASSPATLDTLNELALALGSDPNFATTVATSIGTKQPQLNGTGFIKASGTTITYDNSTYALDSAVVKLTGTQTVGGTKTFTSQIITDIQVVSPAFKVQNSGNTSLYSMLLSYSSGVRIVGLPDKDGTIAMTSDIPTLSSLGGQPALSGTGFVKISGTTVSYDNSTYLTTDTGSSTYVPYTGATSDVNIGTNIFKSNYILLEGDASAGGYIGFKQKSGAQGAGLGYSSIAAQGLNKFYFRAYQTGADVKYFNFDLSSITSLTDRTYTLPDASGTLALTSNLSSYLPLAGGIMSGDIQMGSNQNRIIKFRTATAWDYSLRGVNDDFFITDNPGLNYLALYYNAGGNNRYASLMNVLNVYANGSSTFSGEVSVGSSLVLSAANPFIYGGTAAGGVGLSNIGGQSYIKIYGASHATLANVTQFVNGSSTSFTISSAGVNVYAGADATSNLVLWGQTIRNEGNGAATGYGAGLKLKLSSDGEPYKWAGIAAVAGTGYSNRTDLGLFTAATSTANATEKVRITGDGYVGIGTVSPVARLTIDGDYADMTGTITYSTNTRGIVINQDAGGGYGTGIWFRQAGLTAGIGSTRVSSGDWATDLRFYTHPSVTSNQNTLFERMMINSEGNIGIGTSSFSDVTFGSPALKIAGSRATLGLTSSGTLSTIALTASNNTATSMHLNFENTGAFRWYSYVSAGETFSLLGNGRLGLGVPSPDARLHVGGPILVSNNNQTYRRAITCYGQTGTYTQIKVHFNKTSWGSVAYDIKLGSAGGSHHTAGAYYSNPGIGSHVNSINAGTGLTMTFVAGSQTGDTQGATWTFSGGTFIHPILTIDIGCGNGYQVNPDDIVVVYT